MQLLEMWLPPPPRLRYPPPPPASYPKYTVFTRFGQSNSTSIISKPNGLRPRSLPRPRRGLRGIVFTRSVCLCVCVSVCLSVCPADILVFYVSAIGRDIDLKFIQDTYRVILNSLHKMTFISQISRSQGRYIAFWRYSNITKTEP